MASDMRVREACACVVGCRRHGYLVVRQTGRRENGDLLTTGDRVHHVNRRDARLDHLLGVDSRPRVNGLTWNIRTDRSEAIGDNPSPCQMISSSKSPEQQEDCKH